MEMLQRIADTVAHQRNEALNNLAVASAALAEVGEQREAAWQFIQMAVLSRQIPLKAAARLPGFLAWKGFAIPKDFVEEEGAPATPSPEPSAGSAEA